MYRTNILRRVRKQRLLHDVTLELTYGCNLDCFYCCIDRSKTGTPLSLKQYERLLRDLARMQTLFIMLTGGEPMIHPHFFDIGRMSRDLGFVVRVRTNGHTLGRQNAERLRDDVEPYVVEVSLHGATAEVHDRQTRVKGSFERLLDNIGSAKKAGLRCSVVTTPTTWNEHQIEEMFALCDSIGVPLRFQGPVAPRHNGEIDTLDLQPDQKTWHKITRLVSARNHAESEVYSWNNDIQAPTQTPKVDSETPALCNIGVAGVDIDPYGNVKPCVHLQESAGNLHKQAITDIWENSPIFQRAHTRSTTAAQQFTDKPPSQFGAPLFCIAVEENAFKKREEGGS